MFDILSDTLLDGLKLLPFLFITYLVMEYIEHKTSQRTEQVMKKIREVGAGFRRDAWNYASVWIFNSSL